MLLKSPMNKSAIFYSLNNSKMEINQPLIVCRSELLSKINARASRMKSLGVLVSRDRGIKLCTHTVE